MKTQFTGPTGVSKLNHTEDNFSTKLLTTLRTLAQPDPTPHIGVFAGSLLPYAAWAQPKVPH
jgi:hypothetical protein